MSLNIFPVVYTGPGVEGDMQWMINSGLYPNSIFVFPETFEMFFLSTADGTGNQVVRPYNLFGLYSGAPLSTGIPVTSTVFGPFNALTEVGVQYNIDRALYYASYSAAVTGATSVYFSADPSGTSDPPIFDNLGLAVSSDVIQYITDALYAMGTYTPPGP